MTFISPRLRDRIDAVAHELSKIADAVRSGLPILASMYDALARAINGSHYGDKRYGGHRFTIDIPAGCEIELSPQLPGDDGPRSITIIIPSPSEQQRDLRSSRANPQTPSE